MARKGGASFQPPTHPTRSQPGKRPTRSIWPGREVKCMSYIKQMFEAHRVTMLNRATLSKAGLVVAQITEQFRQDR